MNLPNQILTMPSLIGNATTSVVLREFADVLWSTMINNDRSVTTIKNIYDLSVNDLLTDKNRSLQKKIKIEQLRKETS